MPSSEEYYKERAHRLIKAAMDRGDVPYLVRALKAMKWTFILSNAETQKDIAALIKRVEDRLQELRN